MFIFLTTKIKSYRINLNVNENRMPTDAISSFGDLIVLLKACIWNALY